MNLKKGENRNNPRGNPIKNLDLKMTKLVVNDGALLQFTLNCKYIN